jgi:hypothetical protein
MLGFAAMIESLLAWRKRGLDGTPGMIEARLANDVVGDQSFETRDGRTSVECLARRAPPPAPLARRIALSQVLVLVRALCRALLLLCRLGVRRVSRL